MSYEIGDPNHIQVHNALIADVAEQAERLNVDVILPDPASLGELGHTADHNLIVTALQAIADAPSPGAPWITATGGTTTNFAGDGTTGVVGKNYRRHVFLADGTLTVATAGKCKAFLVAGGGGVGKGTNEMIGAGGAGGVLNDVDVMLPAGALAVRVGIAGLTGYNGGPTSVGPVSVPGGGSGSHDRNAKGAEGGSGGGGGDGTGTGGRGVPGIGNNGGNGGGNPDAGGGGGAASAGVGPVGGNPVTVRGVPYGRGGSVTIGASAAAVPNSGNGAGNNMSGAAGAASTGRAEIWYEIP